MNKLRAVKTIGPLLICLFGIAPSANASFGDSIWERPEGQADVIAVVQIASSPIEKGENADSPIRHFARVERIIKSRRFWNQAQLRAGNSLLLENGAVPSVFRGSFFIHWDPPVQFQSGRALVFLMRSGSGWRGIRASSIHDGYIGITPLWREINGIERSLARDGVSNFEPPLLLSQPNSRER